MHDLGTRCEEALADAEALSGIGPDCRRSGWATVEPQSCAGAVLGDHGLGTVPNVGCR